MYPSRSTTALSRTAYTHPIDPARPAHALDSSSPHKGSASPSPPLYCLTDEDTARDTEHGYTFFASHPPHPRLLTARNIARSFIPHIPPTSDVFHPILPPLEPTQFWVRTSGMHTAPTPVLHVPVVGLHPHVYHQPIRPPHSTRTSVASHVACFTLYTSPCPPSTPTSHIPNYRECRHVAFPLTAAAAPMLLIPHIAAPIPHRLCTDAQHPAMCSTPACVYQAPWPPLLPP
ncbi:hypothetical protein B0H10DRAFT_2225480 [Mycena sp. CBHHK59/15]|nr:hypothetical protein B0H10DRAFT_2225480 [Mycena sp. CBHHK59/15]